MAASFSPLPFLLRCLASCSYLVTCARWPTESKAAADRLPVRAIVTDMAVEADMWGTVFVLARSAVAADRPKACGPAVAANSATGAALGLAASLCSTAAAGAGAERRGCAGGGGRRGCEGGRGSTGRHDGLTACERGKFIWWRPSRCRQGR